MKIFISGPIEKYKDTDYNAPAFLKAKARLEQQGHNAITPIQLHPKDPLSFSPAEYIYMCVHIIDVCDTVYMLKDWQHSKGASIEHQYALNHNKRILYEVADE